MRKLAFFAEKTKTAVYDDVTFLLTSLPKVLQVFKNSRVCKISTLPLISVTTEEGWGCVKFAISQKWVLRMTSSHLILIFVAGLLTYV